MDPIRTTEQIIQCFSCHQSGSQVSKSCEKQSWCVTNRHKDYVCQEKHEYAKDCIPPKVMYCVNCGKDQTAFDKNCKMYQKMWKKLNRVNS